MDKTGRCGCKARGAEIVRLKILLQSTEGQWMGKVTKRRIDALLWSISNCPHKAHADYLAWLKSDAFGL